MFGYDGIAMDCFSSSSFSTTPGSASVEVSPKLLVSPAGNSIWGLLSE
ncbi:hypothetical protein BN135_1989 [Cronobacter muytjensii 530]